MKPSSTSNLLFTVVDVETTMNDKEPTRSESCPFYHRNEVVMAGVMDMTDEGPGSMIHGNHNIMREFNREPGSVLVGQNFKFDLHYLQKCMPAHTFRDMVNNCHIWDCQIAEYVLSGQIKTMQSMDDMAVAYGGVLKEAEHATIKALFANGLGADHADWDELGKYLQHDLHTTADIAQQQMARATEDQFNLIIEMGECLKAIQMMEANGMYVDGDALNEMEEILTGEMITKIAESHIALMEYIPGAEELINAKGTWYNSGNILSAVIFGGTVEYVIKEVAGVFKSGSRKGMVKHKNVTKTITFPPYRAPSDVGSKATKKKSKAGDVIWTTDEAVLDKVLLGCGEGTPMHDMFDRITTIKKYGKLLKTYIANFKSMQIDSVVHHTLNQTIAATGRLTSSNPNLQNVPMATKNVLTNIKRVFTSRYTDGVIMEIDFKQLEVCVLAWLTQDKQLIADIKDGVDIHTTIGEAIHGRGKVTKRQRRDVKTVVFAMIYGAGPKGIHLDSGIPLAQVKEIMTAFYDRYSTINDYYSNLSNKVRDEGHCLEEIYRGPHGPEHYFEWVSPTGRTYKFHQDPFRPGPKFTELRNYPVQGTATGDIVPVLLGHIASVLRNDGHETHYPTELVTTTHDSVTLDCEDEKEARRVLKLLNAYVFDRVGEILNETFPNMDWNVPLTIEVEIGPSWGELKELT